MRPYLTSTALSMTAATIGSLGTTPDSAWYRSLDKPEWQPPSVAFPLVWTPLYGAIAWGTGRALERTRSAADERRVLALTAANLTANAGWNWAFFVKESPAAGLGVIGALNVLNVALVRETARHDRKAAALVPYAAWTGFATALNLAIWRRNR